MSPRPARRVSVHRCPRRPCRRRSSTAYIAPEEQGARMAADTPTKPPTTLGLTGLTSNAMALIAPGAFLWLTFFIQACVRRAAGRAGHVVRHPRRRLAVPGDRHRVRGAVEALSRRRLIVLLRRAGVSLEGAVDRNSPASRSSRSAGRATCITGAIPGLMVGVTALAGRLRGRAGLARHVQRGHPEPAVHDPLLSDLRVRRRLHRATAG